MMAGKFDEITGHSSKNALSRQDVATRYGISTSSVRRLEGDMLHPWADERGLWWFDPVEVAAVQARLPIRGRPRSIVTSAAKQQAKAGRLAAATFCMFARGRSLAEIVVRTKQPPDRVRALYHEWVTSLHEGEFGL